MHTLQVSLSRLKEDSKHGFLNRGSPIPTNLGNGVRQFMFNKKKPRLEPVFEPDYDFALIIKALLLGEWVNNAQETASSGG
jgi:hypothetical protein